MKERNYEIAMIELSYRLSGSPVLYLFDTPIVVKAETLRGTHHIVVNTFTAAIFVSHQSHLLRG